MDKKSPYSAYYFSTVQNITQAQLKAMKSLPEIDISAVKQWMDKHGIYGIVFDDSSYPIGLRKAPSFPYLIYCRWNKEIMNKPILWVVWPRAISPYGKQIIESLFEQLEGIDMATVSGMADGTDQLCHELSIKYNIPTIAILWWWFEHFSCSSKRNLMDKIVAAGWVIMSEYKIAFKPTTWSFPQRNRLIAAMSYCVFIPEARIRSWSLITADVAYDIGVWVYAPMNSIFSETSKWTNTYIADKKIIPIDDIAHFVQEHFSMYRTQMKKKDGDAMLTQEEMKIINVLDGASEATIAMMVEKTWYPLSDLLTYMTMLEMKWYIQQSWIESYMKIK